MIPSEFMATVRRVRPLVHMITNYVTVNDCANITICAGGSPIMTDEAKDVEYISSIASAVVLNMGTLNERTVESMMLAGKTANENGVPVVFDPVGAGASPYRSDTARRIMDEVEISIIKGNAGEIGFLSGIGGEVRGVDSVSAEDGVSSVESLAREHGCVVGMTGETDYASDGSKTLILSNGCDMMGMVSGTGCMLSAVVGAYAGACGPSMGSLASAITAVNVAGEIASSLSNGPGSFKVALLDSLHNLSAEAIDSGIRMEYA